MTELELYLRNRNVNINTWVDSDGLHVLDKETNRCLLFDVNENDFYFILIYLNALHHLSVLAKCLDENSSYDIQLTKIENDQVAITLELNYKSHNFKKEAIVPHSELYIETHSLAEELLNEAENRLK